MERTETFFNFAVSERALQRKDPKCEVVNTEGRKVILREEISDEKSNQVEIGESRRGKVTKVQSEQT